MSSSPIQWTDYVWNPVRGCDKISSGCVHCYAETFAERFRGVPGHPYERGFDIRTVPEKLTEPLQWKKPRRIFVNSMSDLFHKEIPDDYIKNVCATMLAARQHTYQVLTKRHDRLRQFLLANPVMQRQEHIWWGVSVENRAHGLPRLAALQTLDHVQNLFLSIEPLLEDLGPIDLTRIGWVIIGGESGPGARPCNVRWIRNIIAQCQTSAIPVFVKQLGAKPVDRNDAICEGDTGARWPTDTRTEEIDEEPYRGAPVLIRPRDKKGGDMLEWPVNLQYRQFPI